MFNAVTVKSLLPPLPWFKHYKRSINQVIVIDLMKLSISYFNPLLSFNLVFFFYWQLHDELNFAHFNMENKEIFKSCLKSNIG